MLDTHSRLAGALLAALLLAACGDEPAPPLGGAPGGAEPAPALPDEPDPPENGTEVDVEGEPAKPEPPDREALQAQQEERLRQMNEYARGLVDSFRRRVYEPTRDAQLKFAEGLARVRVGDAEGAYRITFDVARPEGERVTVVAEGDVAALPERSERQVQQFAQVALDGPFRAVVQYLPPIDLLLSYSKDRKFRIVTAPPHKHDLQVSYRFDDRELVTVRGISVRPAAEITNYEWTFFRGRYLLSRFWLHGTGGACDLEYDDRETSGVVLMRRALLRKEDRTFDVAFTWERVEAGE